MFQRLRSQLLIAGGVLCASIALLLFFWQSTSRGQDVSRITSVLFDELNVQVAGVINEARGTLSAYRNPNLGPCNVNAIEAMRRLIYTNVYVKDLAITDNAGNILCNASGFEQVVRLRGAAHALPEDGYVVQAVQVEAAQFEGLLISRKLDIDRRLSALVLSNALLSARGQRSVLDGGFALLSLKDGTDVGRYPATRLTAPARSNASGFETIEMNLAPWPLRLKLYVSNTTLDQLVDHHGNMPIVLSAIFFVILAVAAFFMATFKRAAPLDELEQALENGEFIAYYQPVVDMNSGDFVGCEALIRWRKPDGSIVPPGVFIQRAETSGLAVEITVALMERIRNDLEGLYSLHPDLSVGINLFSDHFSRRETAQEVVDVFGSSGIRMDQLSFEVTERLPLASVTMAKQVVRDLQELGCVVALDDVGTGHNGLQYLMELGVDTIKIDKLFVDGVSQSGFSETIIEALVKLAHDMHMGVIAEGVETSDQMIKLKELGIYKAQGYLFSKPLPPEEYLKALERAFNNKSELDSYRQSGKAKDHLQLVNANGRANA